MGLTRRSRKNLMNTAIVARLLDCRVKSGNDTIGAVSSEYVVSNPAETLVMMTVLPARTRSSSTVLTCRAGTLEGEVTGS